MEDKELKYPPLTRKRYIFLSVATLAFIALLVPVLIIALEYGKASETGLGYAAGGEYTQYVNVFAGTDAGNDFPGVSRPFGMVKMGPDNLKTGDDAFSGYLSSTEAPFSGFSMMHESGTGGAPKYGTVSQLPLVGNIKDPLANLTVGRSHPDSGSVGYYLARTSEGVSVEMAASSRAGMYQYTFPEGATGNVVVDVSHVLPSFRHQGLGQEYAGGEFSTSADGHYQGSGIYNNGWNRSPNWKIYFCGHFSPAPNSAQVHSSTGSDDSVVIQSGTVNSTSQQVRIGGLFTFDKRTVVSRVGISFISTEQACQNMDTQIPETMTLSSLIQETRMEWHNEVLSKVNVTSASDANLNLLYTSLYFMNLLPANKTGENPTWTSTEPYYDDIFTLWDLFRCSTALWQVLHPKFHEEFIRSLIDIWRHDGYLPDARSSNYNGRTQGGSNADNVLADAYVKGVRGAVNWTDGYAAMVKDAEVQPHNTVPPDPMAPEASTKEGRGALPDWLKYGFLTTNFTRSASRAVEYAYNDFSLYQVASGLNHTDDAAKYLNRSRNWRNHWNPNIQSLNFSGFIAPRNATDLSFVNIEPLNGHGYWKDYFYEGSSWEYSWADVHDMSHLVTLVGGPETAVKRLETMFTIGADPSNSKGMIFDDTNEPTFLIPYMYNYVGRQDLSVNRSRAIAKKYSASPSGLPGNSDAGAMQTWLLWNMVGLYPVTGQTTFLIHSPWFETMTIDLGGGKTLVVNSKGGDGQGDQNIYVQSLKVNGQNWTKSWLTWEDIFANGGTMDFVLGSEAKNWATGDPPPSPAS